MEIKDKIIEILPEVRELSMLWDCLPSDTITFEPVSKEDNRYYINLDIKTLTWESVILLEVDATHYDERFADADKYEVENMGLLIYICDAPNDELYELTEENVWKFLFLNKEFVQ